jgi:hypothetical protein
MDKLPARIVDGTDITHAVKGGTDLGLVAYCCEFFYRAGETKAPFKHVKQELPYEGHITCMQCLIEGAPTDTRVVGYDGLVHLAVPGEWVDLIDEADYNASYQFLISSNGPTYVLRRREGTTYDEMQLKCGKWAPHPTNAKQTDPITCPDCLQKR